jgi:hypothetical protein
MIAAMEITAEDSRNRGKHREMDVDKFEESFESWRKKQRKQSQRIRTVPGAVPPTDPITTRRGLKRDRELDKDAEGKVETIVVRWLESNLRPVLDTTLGSLLESYCQTTKGKPRKRTKSKGVSNETVLSSLLSPALPFTNPSRCFLQAPPPRLRCINLWTS